MHSTAELPKPVSIRNRKLSLINGQHSSSVVVNPRYDCNKGTRAMALDTWVCSTARSSGNVHRQGDLEYILNPKSPNALRISSLLCLPRRKFSCCLAMLYRRCNSDSSLSNGRNSSSGAEITGALVSKRRDATEWITFLLGRCSISSFSKFRVLPKSLDNNEARCWIASAGNLPSRQISSPIW